MQIILGVWEGRLYLYIIKVWWLHMISIWGCSSRIVRSRAGVGCFPGGGESRDLPATSGFPVVISGIYLVRIRIEFRMRWPIATVDYGYENWIQNSDGIYNGQQFRSCVKYFLFGFVFLTEQNLNRYSVYSLRRGY